MLRDGPDDDEGVVSVLKDGAGEVVDQRVKEEAVSRGVEDHLLKDINNDIKQKKGRGGRLAEALDDTGSICQALR
jgi:hypothetical protein